MADTNKKNMMQWIHIAIFLALTFGIGFLPPFAQITELGMKVLGVFIGIIYGWLFLGLAWPSLIALVALGVIGYGQGGVNGLFVSGFSYQILPQMILCYLFAEAIAQTRLTDYLTSKFLAMKFFAGKPFLMLGAFMMAMFVMNLVHCGLAALFMLWKILREVAAKAGYPERNLFCTVGVTSTLVVFSFSALAFPFNPGTLMQLSYFSKGLPNMAVSDLGWMILFMSFVVVYILVWPVIIKYVLRPDFSAIAKLGDVFADQQNKEMKLTRDQKFGLTMLVLFMLLVFGPSLLPAGLAVTTLLNTIGLPGSLAIVLSIMCVARKEDGKPMLTLQAAAQGISWDVVWLLVATEPIANAFNAAECGILPSIMTAVMPIVSGMSPLVFLVACAFVLGAVTQVVHNLVLIIVFIPILCPMYMQMGGNPYVMLFVLIVAFNAAFTTPAASWSSAIMFGERSAVVSKMYIYGFAAFIVTTALALIMSPLAGFMLG